MTNKINALERLNSFLNENVPLISSLLADLFECQQNSLTDEELEYAVKNGFDNAIKKWCDDYRTFVDNQLRPILENAMKAGVQEIAQQ